jgi:hypothetical protein
LSKLLLGLVLLVGCGRSPDDGKQLCASAPRRCPEGFACYPDGHCWRPPGPGGEDGGSPGPVASRPPLDAQPFQPMESRPGPAAYRQVAGGQQSASTHYRVVRSVPPPPGAGFAQSLHYRMVGGVVGATQR